jgi:cell volume regulation protein A
LYPALTLALVVLTYAAAELSYGNGILAVYIMGVMMGNADFMHKKTVRQFYEGLAWIAQIAMFLMLGLMVIPSQIPGVLVPGFVIGVFLMFIARPLSVLVSLIPFKMAFSRKVMIGWVGLRGAAPIILATFPFLAGLSCAPLIFNIVFIVVLISILVQGTSIPFVSRLIGVDVPFNARRKYPIQFEKTQDIDADLNELIVPYDSAVAGRSIIDIGVPAESLIVLLSRDDKFIIPNGATVIEGGDVLLVLADHRNLAAIQGILGTMKKQEG